MRVTGNFIFFASERFTQSPPYLYQKVERALPDVLRNREHFVVCV
jgi:hypothetical protein